MARTARRAHTEAPRTRLLIALAAAVGAVAACAVIQDPPGGPPDFTPPRLLYVHPDSDSIVPGFHGNVRFQFDEVVDERSGGSLDKLFRVSPRPRGLAVDWKRNAIEVHPDDGWHPNVTYQVTLLPGIADLSRNIMKHGGGTEFSTGGPIPNTAITGEAVNWEEGRIGAGALIEAIRASDSLTYVANADSTGAFTLDAVAPGQYALVATVDQNRDEKRESREAFDSVAITLDSTYHHDFWMFVHDTLGPRIQKVTALDTTAITVMFDQMLAPVPPESDAVQVFQLPDTTPVPVLAVLKRSVYDSVTKAAAAAAAAAKAAAADTARKGADTTKAAADTTHRAQRPPRAGPPPKAREAPGFRPGVLARGADTSRAADSLRTADSARVASLLAQRPRLENNWVVELGLTIAPGTRYLVAAHATNVNGAVEDSKHLFFSDTTRVADTSSASDTTTHADTTRASDTTHAGGHR
ncbi:MAG TPA: Ig-like domain-containing domain [Gemmatimonadales bacterium]|nr:Ig-like domain-containing domain [Gemmatimonadales bacterium]